MERYKTGIENIRKADGVLQTEKEKLNRTDRMKKVMSIESKRIDLILDEFEKPPVLQPQSLGIVKGGKKKQSEIVNDYVDLYKNFNDFNSKFNPKRAEEIKEIDPYHVPKVNVPSESHYPETEGYHRVGYNLEPVQRIQRQSQTEVSYQPVSSSIARGSPLQADDSINANQELTMLQNFKIKPVKHEVYSDPLKAPTGSPSHISKEPIPDRGERRALEQFKIRSKADYDSNVYGMQADYRQQTPSQGRIQGQPSFMEDDYEQYKEMSLSQE